MPAQEQVESLDFVLSEACSRPDRQKPQLVLAGATLPSAAQLQSYTHKVLCLACSPVALWRRTMPVGLLKPCPFPQHTLACRVWVSTSAEHALLR